jgi:hypothetical protein
MDDLRLPSVISTPSKSVPIVSEGPGDAMTAFRASLGGCSLRGSHVAAEPGPETKRAAEAALLTGGDKGDRTPDLVNAIHALSQLSYIPVSRDASSTGGLGPCQASPSSGSGVAGLGGTSSGCM